MTITNKAPAIILGITLLGLVHTTEAEVLNWTTIEERVGLSDVILVGKIRKLQSYIANAYFLSDRPDHVTLKQFGDQEMIFTKVTLSPSEILLGPVSHDLITFQVRGGRIGKMSTPFQFGYQFEVGNDIGVFLARIGEDNSVYPLAKEKGFGYRLATQAGLFYMEKTKDGDRLVPAFAGAFVNAPRDKSELQQSLPLGELRRIVRAHGRR